MKRVQLINLLKLAMVCTALMFACEVIFFHSAVTNFFSNLILNAGVWTWVVVWLIMFIQVWAVPVPAYIVLSAGVTLKLNNYIFFVVTISAYIVGCIVAYFIGLKWGKKAVKWCAGSEEDYEKWSRLLGEKGKWWYALTVLFPIFPDDLLCFACGSVKMNFWFFLGSNAVCRAIGLATMMLFLNILNLGSSLTSLIAWGVVLLVEIVAYIIVLAKVGRVDKQQS